jgi:poly [ADP-ribose] polymerase
MQVASGLETVRDINDASHLIGDVFGSTLDDPLSECYKKLGCSINPVAEDSEDYKMILRYLETTYEPVKVDDVVRYHTPIPEDPFLQILPMINLCAGLWCVC